MGWIPPPFPRLPADATDEERRYALESYRALLGRGAASNRETAFYALAIVGALVVAAILILGANRWL